jgi:NTP pyrophosphatase (non-canonical NTP hydrolase)
MTWEEYKIEALKTWNKENFTEAQAFEYIIMKLIEEFGELIGSLAKEKYHGKPNNNIEELGDIFWYLAVWESMIERALNLNDSFCGNIVGEIHFCLINLINVSTFQPINWTYCYLGKVKASVNGIVKELNLSKELIWQANIAKLRARHGESYNHKHYTGELNG